MRSRVILFVSLCLCAASYTSAEVQPQPAPLSSSSSSSLETTSSNVPALNDASEAASSAPSDTLSESSSSTSLSSDAEAEHVEGKNEDLPALKVEMAADTFALDPSLENRGALILAYERLIATRCMPTLLTSLIHAPQELQASCRKAIEGVREIDALNPVALCAENGIDSSVCREAAKQQKVGLFGPSFDAQRLLAEAQDIPKGTTPRFQDSVGMFLKELEAAKAVPAAQRDRSKIQTLYHRLMLLTCPVVRLSLTPETPRPTPHSRSSSRLGSSENIPLEKIVENFASQAQRSSEASISYQAHPFEPTPSLSETPSAQRKPDQGKFFSRKRLISNTCWYFVKNALIFEPGFASAICHQDGFQSPTCIDALRESRKKLLLTPKPTRAPSTGPSGGPGFKTF